MSRMRRGPGSVVWVLLAGVLAFGVYAVVRTVGGAAERPGRTYLQVGAILAGDAETGYARAMEPRPFVFPEDHGPHPEFRSEWWYVTGNLEGPDGEPFGFQVTFFRTTLEPRAAAGPSAWATNQAYMGHFAFTDASGDTFRAYERFERGALNLAGAQIGPFRVWLGDWSMQGPAEGESVFPLRLRVAEGDRGVDLVLRPDKPLVLQGDRGLSRKGPEPGNASYYYSFTRLDARGAVTIGGRNVPVQGQAWIDREWSTSALSSDQVGWDWFALQLSDGRDLTYYRLRSRDGGTDRFSGGVLVDREGTTRALTPEMVQLQVLTRWNSPGDGVSYPSRWRLRVADEDLDLEVAPILADQELRLSFRYWEGAVRVRGQAGDLPVEGKGYVELTGYGEPGDPPREFLPPLAVENPYGAIQDAGEGDPGEVGKEKAASQWVDSPEGRQCDRNGDPEDQDFGKRRPRGPQAEEQKRPEAVEGQLNREQDQGHANGSRIPSPLPHHECGNPHQDVQQGPHGTEDPGGWVERGFHEVGVPVPHARRGGNTRHASHQEGNRNGEDESDDASHSRFSFWRGSRVQEVRKLLAGVESLRTLGRINLVYSNPPRCFFFRMMSWISGSPRKWRHRTTACDLSGLSSGPYLARVFRYC